MKENKSIEQSSVKNRLIEFLKYKNISQGEFEKTCQLSNGYVNNIRKSIKSEKYDENIAPNFPELNKYWLLFDEGEMLTDNNKSDYPIKKTPFEELQEKWEKADNYLIPLYDDVSTFGGNVETDTNQTTQPTEYINAGSWFGKTKLTAGIRHYGDSMVEYPNGCILAIKEIHDLDEITPGNNYVVETTERRVTKKLQTVVDDKIFMAYSTNIETHPDGTLIHQPFPIKKEKIRKISLVIGRIVKEHGSGEVITS